MKRETLRYLNDFAASHEGAAYLVPEIMKVVELIVALGEHGKILVCGNGGSAADSEHFSGELLKSFMLKRPVERELKNRLVELYPDGKDIADNLQRGLKVIPLTSFNCFSTAFGNDCASDHSYAQLVNVLGEKGDVFLGISTSGNSANVLYAAKVAKAKGLHVVSMTGATGGKMKEVSDILLNVPETVVWKVQELHLPVYHLICLCVENELFGE